jgi:hypothetical protein
MTLYLRKVIHDNYRVILNNEGDEVEIGDCMTKFMAAWDRFAANEANLVEFLNAKRKRR